MKCHPIWSNSPKGQTFIFCSERKIKASLNFFPDTGALELTTYQVTAQLPLY